MTVQPNIKSTAITSLDATPPVRSTAGKGGAARSLVCTATSPAFTTGDTAGGIARMVRVPSNCVVKRVAWAIDAAVTTFDCDVGLYYSDALDGTSATHVAATTTAIDADFFASAVDMHSLVVGWTDITFEAASGYLPSESNKELWDAAGLSSDPQGFIDICATNTSTTSGAPVLSLLVEYTTPGD